MIADSRQQLLEILDAVLAAPETEHSDLLAKLCQGDGELQRKVEELLALEGEGSSFLAEPAVQIGEMVGRSHGTEENPSDLEPGQRLGPYRIVEFLARGGMGTVYRAVREDDFEKLVAVKLIQRGLGSRSALQRFHAERQILARLEHPSIARLLDGGTTEDGRPYLVMEYVEGVPITEFVEERGLDIRQRLGLFEHLLTAVAYAHQNLIVHRDLKPGNILVNSQGELKLLDFGIAKPLDPQAVLAESPLTQSAESPLTPRYASPEQVLGKPITTASDVYSLGVLLYQLLTGDLPNDLEHCNSFEVARRICYEDPIRPSASMHRETTAHRRPRERRRLHRALSGDVDAIVLKALRKEPVERYASVERFADDLDRHLTGLPVRARRGAWTYRASKFLRRHKGFVTAAVLVLALGIGATLQWRQAHFERHRADHERTEAVAERHRAERVSQFLQELFEATGPDQAQGRELTAVEILEAGRRRLSEGLEDDPRTTAELVGTLGNVYRSLGLYEEALELLEQSVELRQRLYPEGHPELALALSNLGSAHYYVGNYTDAERRFRQVLELRLRLENSQELVAHASSNLASALKQLGRIEEAGTLAQRVLTLREQLHPSDDVRIASSLYTLGSLRYEEGKLSEAIPRLRRALEIRRSALGSQHTEVATIQSSLGRALQAQQDLEEAEELHRSALETRLERLGEQHDHVAIARRDLASVLLDRGEIEPAGQLLSLALGSLRNSRVPGDWTLASTESLWGEFLLASGRVEEAMPFIEESLVVLRRVKGERSIYTQQAMDRAQRLRQIRSPDPKAGGP